MRPITHMIADLLVVSGFVGVALQPALPVLLETKKREQIQTAVRTVKAYDPDEEFVPLLQPKYVPFDMSFTKDIDDTPIASVSATLYEVSADGTSYTLNKYTTREQLVEALERGRNAFGRHDDLVVDAPWNLREVASVVRHRTLEVQAADVLDHALTMLREGYSYEAVKQTLRETALREDSFSQGSNVARYSSFSRDWDTNSSYGDGRDANQEYAPIMGGPWSKQLYLHQYLDMHAKAFEAYNHNPYARQIVQLTTMFTLGRSLDFTCNNTEVDEVCREFVDRTDYFARLETMMNDLWWAGENITEFYDNTPSKGQTDFRAVDPSTVWEIVTDPEDIRKVYYAHQQYSTPYQEYVTGVTSAQQPASVRYIIRQIPAKKFFHTKINVSDWEKRGRTDLFAVMGWLKRLKDLMNARVVKGQLEAAFVWDITIKTGDADVDSIGLQLPDPYNPGATFIHNAALELKPQSANMGGSNAAPDIAALLGMIATGAGTSLDFLGGAANGRGSSGMVLARTEPTTKKYEQRQTLIERYCYKMFDRVIQNAVDAKTIDLDEILADARTVKRLGAAAEELPDMDDKRDEMDEKQQIADKQQQDVQDQQQAIAQQQADANTQLAQQGAGKNKVSPTPLVNVNRSQQKPGAQEAVAKTSDKAQPKSSLNADQKKRIAAIKESGLYARELIEFSFPSIAQEDRPAKLKDLALAEAMEWLPKSVVATMAARELNITTYDFMETWAMIVDEAKKGMSIAHVFGQDNKHVPDVAIAQSVQEEQQAEQPVASQPMVNVPVPPVVNGMKQEPGQGGAGGPGGPPTAGKPGAKPNTGDSKTNQSNQVMQPRAASPSHGYSKAANSPMTSEGRANIKTREAMQTAIYGQLLKEAIKPLTDIQTGLARFILERPGVVQELEASVAELQRDST